MGLLCKWHRCKTWDGEAMKSIQELKKRLAELDEEIAEAKRRLPAHSTKPPTMMALLALEDEYEEVLSELERLKKTGDNRREPGD
jgi:hypothetical protein